MPRRGTQNLHSDVHSSSPPPDAPGTLVVFCSVCAGVLFRRYHVHGSGEPVRPVLNRLGAVVLVR